MTNVTRTGINLGYYLFVENWMLVLIFAIAAVAIAVCTRRGIKKKELKP